MHRRSTGAPQETNKRSYARKEERGYDWAHGIPAWTSVTDCKGVSGVDVQSGGTNRVPVAETYNARRTSQNALSIHQVSNDEDRRQASASRMIGSVKDAARDESPHTDGNRQIGEEKPSLIRSKESSLYSSSRMQQIHRHSLSRGAGVAVRLNVVCGTNIIFGRPPTRKNSVE